MENVAINDGASTSQSVNNQNGSVTLSMDQLRQLLNEKNVRSEVMTYSDTYVEFEDETEKFDEPLSSDEEMENVAEPVDEKLAAFVDSRLTEEESVEKLKIKFQKASRPSNIKYSKEVKMEKSLFNKSFFHYKEKGHKSKKDSEPSCKISQQSLKGS